MSADLDVRPPETEADEAAPSGRPSVDEVSECSFPASDPPAVWTWEVPDRQARS
jgi:hypothetical protein